MPAHARTRGPRPFAGVIALLCAVTGFVLAVPAPPAEADDGALHGFDVSWPQCSKALGGFDLPLPPDDADFVIIGLSKGLAFTENPCLETQADWARDRAVPAHAYAMATFPTAGQLERYGAAGPWGPDTRTGRLANAGYAEAQFALTSLAKAGWAPPTVWVDVEPRPAQPWPGGSTSAQAENRRVVEGLIRGLQDAGVAVGIYSYTRGWDEVTGGWRVPGVPVWATAGTLDYPTEAQDRCTQPTFSGGTAVLAQWTDGTRDYNRTCGDHGLGDLPENLARAPFAEIRASSQTRVTDQPARSATDGAGVGYPDDHTMEWATTGGKSGSWIEVAWDRDVRLGSVVLRDRPNAEDQVLAGTLVFSDGSSVPVGALDNAGAAVRVDFAARTVRSARFVVDSVSGSTANVGLAEFEAWGAAAASTDQAGYAFATASSENEQTLQGAAKAIDGVADGYPGDHTREWATLGGGAGSRLDLSWPTPVRIDGLVLHDRPNPDDRVESGIVRFSDGSEVAFGRLPDDGRAWGLTLRERTVTSARIEITSVSATTLNVGLSEVEVLGRPAAESNIARSGGASVTASSANTATGQVAAKVADGRAVGFPVDHTREWATVGGRTASWLQVSWPGPMLVSRVVLHDRPNLDDQILGGTIHFGSGETVEVGPLENTGGRTVIPFTPRVETSVRFTVTTVSGRTLNVGLAELEVWGSRAP